MNASIRCLSALAGALLAAPILAASQVHVVATSAGAGVDFTNLKAAINAAAEGDVLLIKPGTYSAGDLFDPEAVFTITGKSLTLVADNLASVRLISPFRISGLAAGQQVCVRGLKIELFDNGTALSLLDNAGSVWIEDCTLSSTPFVFLQFAIPMIGHAVSASACSSLVFARCSLTGLPGVQNLYGIPSTPGRHGLNSTSSNVCLYDCQLRGGAGAVSGGDGPYDGGDGGDGAHLAGGFLFASGTTFTGGAGGEGFVVQPFGSPCTHGGDGGDGLHLAGGAPLASTLSCTFTAGAPGPSGGMPCSATGSPGAQIDIDSGTHTPLAGEAHHLNVTAAVREGQGMVKNYTGPAGELVFADYGGLQGFAYIEAFRGVLVLSSPFFTQFEGTMPASGVLTKSFTLNPLSAGTEGLTLYLQAGFLNFTSGIFQGAPSATVLLDSAF